MRVYSPAGPQIAARLHSKCTAERRCTINFDLNIHVESCHHRQSYPHPFNLEGQVQQHHSIIFGAGHGRSGVGIVELASVILTVVSKNKCTNLAILHRELSPSCQFKAPTKLQRQPVIFNVLWLCRGGRTSTRLIAGQISAGLQSHFN